MDRLSPQDLITFWPDEVGWPQDMGALAVMDGGPLTEADGGVRVDVVRTVVSSRLASAPRLRQVVYAPPRGLGRPLWVDAPGFDLSHHVRVHPVPLPGEQPQLLDVVETLRRRPLHPSRPLWEMWLLPGLSGGRIGLYLRLHHALADGPAAIAMLAGLFDDVDDVPRAPGPSWTPTAPPSRGDLLRDNLDRYARALRRALAGTRPHVLVPRLRAARAEVRAVLSSGRAARSSLNRPIGPDRRFAVVRSELALIRQAATGCDATVNDVLLTAVAGGLRQLLSGRGEPVENLVLQAVVPIALPHRRGEGQLGNLLGQMIVPLPVGEADPLRRLQLIAVQTADRKQLRSPRRVPVLRSRALRRAALSLLAHQRGYNVYVANLPGPRTALHLAGVRLLEMFPVVPLMGNVTVGVGALSYAGAFTLMAVGDRATCPDLDVFAAGVDGDLRALTAVGTSAGAAPPP